MSCAHADAFQIRRIGRALATKGNDKPNRNGIFSRTRKEQEGKDEEVHRTIIGVPDWARRGVKMQDELFDATPVREARGIICHK
jgi:hypothetical protein